MGQHAWIDSLSQSARSILKHHPGGSSAELIWTEALRGVEPECAPSGGLPLSTTQCLGEGIDGNLSPTLARTPPQETPPPRTTSWDPAECCLPPVQFAWASSLEPHFTKRIFPVLEQAVSGEIPRTHQGQEAKRANSFSKHKSHAKQPAVQSCSLETGFA